MSSSTSASEPTPGAAARRYLATVVLVCAVSALALAAFNFAMDPFALFRQPARPTYFAHARLAKAKAVERLRPAVVILGTSRAEIAFDPGHPGFAARPVYNLALSGANLMEIERYLEHAQAVQPLRQVILEAEFFTFNAARPPTPDFDPAVLRVPDRRRVLDRLPAVFEPRLFSRDMLLASLRAQAGVTAGAVSHHLADGRVEHDGARAQVEATGHFAMFGPPLHAMMTSREVYADLHTTDPATGRSTYDELARLLRFARRHGIDLRVVIPPSHALLFEAIHRAGSWERFEDWKRTLVRLVAEEAAEHPGAPAHQLWDFSGYNSITTEPIPAPGDRVARMRWFWEAVHVKRETGDLVLDRVLGRPGVGLPDDFGRRLAPDDLEAHLRRIRADRDGYLAGHAGIVEAILGAR
jgi:hypothetical protein